MKTTARTPAGERRSLARAPLSVTVSPDLRRRLAREAGRRNLKVATTARVLIDERIGELEDEAQLSRAEEWQRAQAWATWDKIAAGDVREVSWERLEREGRKAIARVRNRVGADRTAG